MYQSHVRETRRIDAKSALVDLAQLQEKFYFSEDEKGNTNHKYATDFDVLNKAEGLGGVKIVDATTLESREGYYQITFVDPAPKSFKFTAIPTEKGGQNNDNCKEFSIDNVGNKDSKSEPEGEKCW